MNTCSYKLMAESIDTLHELAEEIADGMEDHPVELLFGDSDSDSMVVAEREGSVFWRVFQTLNDGSTAYCEFCIPFNIPEGSSIAQEASCCEYQRDFFGDVVPHWAWGAVVIPSPTRPPKGNS